MDLLTQSPRGLKPKQGGESLSHHRRFVGADANREPPSDVTDLETSQPVHTRTIRILGLKRWATERLRRGSPFREIILTEKDELEAEELLAKLDIWLRLLHTAKSERVRGVRP